MKVLWVLTILAVACQGQMDKKFCGTYHDNPHRATLEKQTSEFTTVIESTKKDVYQVNFESLTLSSKNQILKMDRITPQSTIKAYVFPDMNIIKESKFVPHKGGQCISQKLDDSVIAKDFNIKRDAVTKKLNIPPMTYMLSYSSATSPAYISNATVRGISAQHWRYCAYQDWSGDTISVDLYYSDAFQMPGSKNNVPLLMESKVQSITGSVSTYRYDYTNYIDHVRVHSKDLEVPTDMYCMNDTNADNMIPNPPDSFHYQGIESGLGDINRIPPPKPSLKFVKVTYSGIFSFKIFTEDNEEPSPIVMTKIKSRLVHDYNAGLQYEINTSTGMCAVGDIKKDNVDFVKHWDGFVEQKDARQFFELDKAHHYQYIGKHYHFDRDIEADVFVHREGSNNDIAQTTWWFASRDFLKEMGYKENVMIPLRFRKRTQNPDRVKQFDFFQFSSRPTEDQLFPDLTPCFPPANQLFLEIYLSGRYTKLYLDNPGYFRAAFNTAIMKATVLVNLLRITRVTVQPADKDTTLVKFVLLDKPTKTGNVMGAIDEIGNDVVWKRLKAVLDAKKFVVEVHNDFGTLKAPSTKYGLANADPTSFKIRQVALSGTSGYSAGAMGGLAVGMILLGFLFGFGSTKGFKKYQNRTPDIGMQDLRQAT